MHCFLKFRLAAVAFALAAGMAVAAPGIASAAQANQQWFGYVSNGFGYWLGNPSASADGGSYSGQIHNWQAPSLCLDVPGPSFFQSGYFEPGNPAGAQVQLYNCTGNDNQGWFQLDNRDGSWSYYTVDGTTDYCLDSLAGHHYPGSPVEVYPCNGGNAQKWTIGPGGQLQSVDSPGFCADDRDFGTAPGSQIQLWYCAY